MAKRSVCVVGLGYIGLPTAAVLASRGIEVFGADINGTTVAEVAAGRTHMHEPQLDDLLADAVRSGLLRAGARPVVADVYIVAVPTPIRDDHGANLDMVVGAAQSVAKVLKPGDLVILESTVPPGTTNGIFRETLEGNGCIAGRDFLLAHCPERVLPGNLLAELIGNDRIIGGIDEASTKAAVDVYLTFVRGALIETDATTAELVKLMENTYRDVNIALANEFALIAERLGIDVWEAIEHANRHPRVKYLRPGPGVGGHCIAVDPWFIVEAAPDLARLISTARSVNDSMPEHVVELARQAVGDLRGAAITTLGLTYKANVGDLRESPAVTVVTHLRRAGAVVRTHDPLVGTEEAAEDAVAGASLLVMLVDHDAYSALDPREIGPRMRSRVVLDTRGVLDRDLWEAAGFRVHTLGQAGASVLVGGQD